MRLLIIRSIFPMGSDTSPTQEKVIVNKTAIIERLKQAKEMNKKFKLETFCLI